MSLPLFSIVGRLRKERERDAAPYGQNKELGGDKPRGRSAGKKRAGCDTI